MTDQELEALAANLTTATDGLLGEPMPDGSTTVREHLVSTRGKRCGGCGNTGTVLTRTPDGLALCRRCLTRYDTIVSTDIDELLDRARQAARQVVARGGKS